MASFDFSKLASPVSADQPCGPDLDVEGDPDFAQFVARAEGIFPPSFFTRNDDGKLQPFDRTTIEFATEYKSLDRLLADTHDLRLLVIYGRLLALDRDLAGFADCISAAAMLLRDNWEDVPPRGEGGEYGLRTAVLQGFDDNPTIILPLQYLPLVQTRRSGAVTFRSVLVSTGEANARPDEQTFDRGALERALGEAELDDLKATSDHLHKVADAVDLIGVVTTEKGGYENTVTLEKLSALAPKMAAFIDAAIAGRDPTSVQAATQAASEPQGGSAAVALSSGRSSLPSGSVSSAATAGIALAAVLAYFQKSEPSNPAVLLVQQAQALMGKSFPDVMKLLLPGYAERAKIEIGADKLFGLTFEQFAVSNSAASSAGEPADQGAATGSPEDAAVTMSVASRGEAGILLDQVGSFYRVAEPSSPIPLLTERARSMIERDFLTILKDVLPIIARRDE